jgi:hypothetical protein
MTIACDCCNNQLLHRIFSCAILAAQSQKKANLSMMRTLTFLLFAIEKRELKINERAATKPLCG